jgi:hypothetical protein
MYLSIDLKDRNDHVSTAIEEKNMKKTLAGVLAIILMASCTPTPLPTCPTGDLIPPIPSFPGDYTIVTSLSPSFQWTYPDDCVPEGYSIEVTTYGGYGYGTTITGGTGSPATSWGPASPLEPATDYEWHVAAINGTTLGPWSDSYRFWTGPICAPDDLEVPIPLGPPDGSTQTTPHVPLNWQYPDPCVPTDYYVELDTSPSFPGPNLMADPIAPATAQIHGGALTDCTMYYWHVQAIEAGVTTAFSPTWSFYTDFDGLCPAPEPAEDSPSEEPSASDSFIVTGIMDANCREGPDLLFGEYGYLMEGETAEAIGRLADNSWFRIQIEGLLDACWTNTAVLAYAFDPAVLPILAGPPLFGGISGLVWHDLCSPGEHGATPTPGCVPLGGGGYGANGIYEAGEPGIAGVLIHLGAGACPSTGLATTTTGGSGAYSFSSLAPGTYCVSSSVLENGSILIPGGWTYPSSGSEWVRHTVVVTPGDTITGMNFGFDYQFLP